MVEEEQQRILADLTQRCERLTLKSWLIAINNFLQIGVRTQQQFVYTSIQNDKANEGKKSTDITHTHFYSNFERKKRNNKLNKDKSKINNRCLCGFFQALWNWVSFLVGLHINLSTI